MFDSERKSLGHFCDAVDFKVVQLAGFCLAEDIALVTGSKPQMKAGSNALPNQAAIIGTLGKSAVGDKLAREGKISTHTLKLLPLDPGLVFDKLVIDLGGLQPTHLGPPETALNN